MGWLFSIWQVATDLADTALNVLSFAAEVRSGLWRKNGQCMNDQVRGRGRGRKRVLEIVGRRDVIARGGQDSIREGTPAGDERKEEKKYTRPVNVCVCGRVLLSQQ